MDIFEELINVTRAFEEAGIEYALCGGLAMGILAEPRFTRDIDLLILEEDLPRAKEALKSVDFILSSGIIPFKKLDGGFREIQRISKAEGSDLMALDLLLVSDDLQDAWDGRELHKMDDIELKVVSRDGLITMKELAGRPQDLVDIQKLKEHG
jgi:hypothetical protein